MQQCMFAIDARTLGFLRSEIPDARDRMLKKVKEAIDDGADQLAEIRAERLVAFARASEALEIAPQTWVEVKE